MTILDTLDELTKERREQHVPTLDDGTLGKAQKVIVKPLLTRIRERTYPSGEQNGGSSGLKSTRAPIDFDALAILAPILATINAWCLLEEVDLVRDPAVDLRRWYFRWDSHPREDYERTFHEKHMRRWVRQIKDHLDPPVVFDADDPCPICGATSWGDVINGGGSHPIRIQYRKIDGAMRDERALCRACQTVWDGHEAVTHLENIRRRASSKKTHCVNGHEFTPENTHIQLRSRGRKTRICLKCRTRRQKARKALKLTRTCPSCSLTMLADNLSTHMRRMHQGAKDYE